MKVGGVPHRVTAFEQAAVQPPGAVTVVYGGQLRSRGFTCFKVALIVTHEKDLRRRNAHLRTGLSDGFGMRF